MPAGGSPAGISPLSFFSAIWPSWRARPAISAFRRADQARDRRGHDADELAVEDVAGGQARERQELLGVDGLRAEQTALELEQVGLARGRSAAPWPPPPRRRARRSAPSGPPAGPSALSAPTSSAARSVSEFLTTRKIASASRRRVRSSAAWGTEMPRKSTAKTASDSLSDSAISATAAAFCSRFMGLLARASARHQAAPPGVSGGLEEGLLRPRPQQPPRGCHGCGSGRSSRPGPWSRPW